MNTRIWIKATIVVATLIAMLMAATPAYADRSAVTVRKHGKICPITQKHRNAINQIEHIMRRSGDKQNRPTKFSYSCNEGNQKIRQIVATFPKDEQFVLSEDWGGECYFYIPPVQMVMIALK